MPHEPCGSRSLVFPCPPPGRPYVVIGGGPAGPDRRLLARQGGRAGHRPRGRGPGRRHREDRSRARRLSLRPGRPPLLHEGKEVDDMWHEIMGEEFLERPRMSRIYWNGKFLDYPLAGHGRHQEARPDRAAAAACLLPLGRDQAKGTRGQPRAVGLQPLRQAPLQPLLQVLHREGVGRPDAPRCAPSGPRSASRACRSSAPPRPRSSATSGNKIKSLIGKFNYPRYGPGQMWER